MPERPFQPNHLYVQVRNELVRRIASGAYPANALLPNEFSLSQEMQVSVGTVRKAIEALSAERLLIRNQGRGTVVADRQSADYQRTFDRVRHADGSPITWRFREVERELRAPTPEEQKTLQIGPDQRILSLRRQRQAEGRVVKSEYVRLPLEIYDGIEDLDVAETTVESLSVLKGVPIAYAEEKLSLVYADGEQAAEFDVAPGTPIIRLERIVFSGGKRPIEWRIAHCHLQDMAYHAPSPIGGKTGRV